MSRTDRDEQPAAQITRLDRMVHEPARLAILAVLNAFETADFVFLLKQTELSRGNLSSHLGKLEASGYVEMSKEFVGRIPRTLVRLTETGRDALSAYRREMKGFIDNL